MTESKKSAPTPTAITIRTQTRVLEITFDDGVAFSLPFELLRVIRLRRKCAGMEPARKFYRPASARCC